MTNEKFIEKAKELVVNHTTELTGNAGYVPPFDVFVVWNTYILGNIKAMLSTTISNGMYYEVTYNKAKNEIYFDAYKKVENRKVEL